MQLRNEFCSEHAEPMNATGLMPSRMEGATAAPDYAGDQIVARGGSHGARPMRPVTTLERLRTLHQLYERLGSLEAVGRQVGLTRERVRQLLARGNQQGLFVYNPRKYPCVPKEQIIEDYKMAQSISRVARLNHITVNHLKKLLANYSIAEPQLARYRLEGRRARCVAEYMRLVEKEGRYLSSGDLHDHPAGIALYARIIRCWGSIHTFCQEQKIPMRPWSRNGGVGWGRRSRKR